MSTPVYVIKETQNVNSDREGTPYNGTLNAAKRYASKNQCFAGTTLKIENIAGELIAYKNGKHWVYA